MGSQLGSNVLAKIPLHSCSFSHSFMSYVPCFKAQKSIPSLHPVLRHRNLCEAIFDPINHASLPSHFLLRLVQPSLSLDSKWEVRKNFSLILESSNPFWDCFPSHRILTYSSTVHDKKNERNNNTVFKHWTMAEPGFCHWKGKETEKTIKPNNHSSFPTIIHDLKLFNSFTF